MSAGILSAGAVSPACSVCKKWKGALCGPSGRMEGTYHMNQQRVEKVLARMEAHGLSQMIVSDPYSINYLTGRYIDPGERFLALYLSGDGNHRIFINNLFTVPEDLGVMKIRFSDSQDAAALFCGYVDHGAPLGVDKNLPARFLLRMMELDAAKDYVNASDCVDLVRSCKDAGEREKMRAASRLNDLAMERFLALVKPGVTEQEIAVRMEPVYRSLGADGCSFSPLVAFGRNAANGHHAPGGTPLHEGDCVLFDVGCKKDGYCSDMTRTFFFRSVPERGRQIYEIVRRANEAAEAAVRPGVRFCDIDRAARSVIEQAGFGPNFTHRLGHSIGLEVHEPGDVSSAHCDAVLPGMTFSIEPGVYLEGEAGVRIEDLVLVTETGCEVLNRFPKELKVVR